MIIGQWGCPDCLRQHRRHRAFELRRGPGGAIRKIRLRSSRYRQQVSKSASQRRKVGWISLLHKKIEAGDRALVDVLAGEQVFDFISASSNFHNTSANLFRADGGPWISIDHDKARTSVDVLD